MNTLGKSNSKNNSKNNDNNDRTDYPQVCSRPQEIAQETEQEEQPSCPLEYLKAVASLSGENLDTFVAKALIVGSWVIFTDKVKQTQALDFKLVGSLDAISYSRLGQEYYHEFSKPKPLLMSLPDGSIFIHRAKSSYKVASRDDGVPEVHG